MNSKKSCWWFLRLAQSKVTSGSVIKISACISVHSQAHQKCKCNLEVKKAEVLACTDDSITHSFCPSIADHVSVCSLFKLTFNNQTVPYGSWTSQKVILFRKISPNISEPTSTLPHKPLQLRQQYQFQQRKTNRLKAVLDQRGKDLLHTNGIPRYLSHFTHNDKIRLLVLRQEFNPFKTAGKLRLNLQLISYEVSHFSVHVEVIPY